MADWPDGIDMDALLAPIEGDSPTGEDLREDFSPQSMYYRLRDARAEARAAERAADANPGEDSVVPPQWRTVRDLALTALAGRTKDLEIAAWLTEALVRSDGLAGLAAGAHVIAGLAVFWDDNLYPMPDEDGIATRVAPVAGLNGEGGGGTLFQPLRKLPLFNSADGRAVAYWNFEQSEELAKESDPEKRDARIASGLIPLDIMERDARAAGQKRFATLRDQAQLAIDEWRGMGDALDARAGMDGPPTSAVRDLLEKIQMMVSRFAGEPESAGGGDDGYAPSGGGESEGGGGGGGGGGLRLGASATNREDILKELIRIAEHFKKTEPQSPLAYTLEEAVRRSRMTWPELMAEIVQDQATRENILMQLGIKPPAPEEASY
jgi:type VI secretion system protein ImpA